MGDRRQETEDRRQEAGDRIKETRDRRWEMGEGSLRLNLKNVTLLSKWMNLSIFKELQSIIENINLR